MTENIHCSPDIETLSAFIAEGLNVVIIVSIYLPSDYNGHIFFTNSNLVTLPQILILTQY